mmetsp:Transcript_134814/g.319561  ORF Transcript_134814/g.319561 Transcript_134814/m.319561 type:complete len:213 (+) Transcript_134814:1165-1803(+)
MLPGVVRLTGCHAKSRTCVHRLQAKAPRIPHETRRLVVGEALKPGVRAGPHCEDRPNDTSTLHALPVCHRQLQNSLVVGEVLVQARCVAVRRDQARAAPRGAVAAALPLQEPRLAGAGAAPRGRPAGSGGGGDELLLAPIPHLVGLGSANSGNHLVPLHIRSGTNLQAQTTCSSYLAGDLIQREVLCRLLIGAGPHHKERAWRRLLGGMEAT